MPRRAGWHDLEPGTVHRLDYPTTDAARLAMRAASKWAARRGVTCETGRVGASILVRFGAANG